jgi:hypothetical protein
MLSVECWLCGVSAGGAAHRSREGVLSAAEGGELAGHYQHQDRPREVRVHTPAPNSYSSIIQYEYVTVFFIIIQYEYFT